MTTSTATAIFNIPPQFEIIEIFASTNITARPTVQKTVEIEYLDSKFSPIHFVLQNKDGTKILAVFDGKNTQLYISH